MSGQGDKAHLVRQWADWSLLRVSGEGYEIRRNDRSLSQKFEARDDQAALKESCQIVRNLEKPEP